MLNWINNILFKTENYLFFRIFFAGFSALFFVSWWFFLYSPTSNEVLNFKQKINQLEHLKMESEQIFSECCQLREKIKELSCKFDRVCQGAKREICEQVTLVFECACKHNIQLKYCTPVNTKEAHSAEKEWYKKISFEMAFEGYFHQVAYFLKCLLNSKFIVQCQKCLLKKNNHKVECVGIFDFIQILENNE